MPRASTALEEDEVLRYQPLDPPLKQVNFPHRRRSVRRRTPASTNKKPPSLTESQSTCTQYFERTPNTSFTELSGDERMSDPASDFEDDRPLKKQKTAKRGRVGSSSGRKNRRGGLFDEREPDQQSYTQMMRDGPLHKQPRHLQTDTQGWQLFEKKDTLTPIERIKRQQQKREAADLDITDWTKDDSGYDTRHSSQPKAVVNCLSQVDQGDFAEKENVPARCMPSKEALQTPKNVRFEKVIPSSQSPVSQYQLSTQKSQRILDMERSPLKDRSVNILSPTKTVPTLGKADVKVYDSADVVWAHNDSTPRGQAATPRQRLRRTPMRVASQKMQKNPTFDPPSKTMPPPPASLKHKSTISNSSFVEGAEDIMDGFSGLETEPSQLADVLSGAVTEDSAENSVIAEESTEPRPPARQPRQLGRVSTIQDSESEDMDLDDIEAPYNSSVDSRLPAIAECASQHDDQLRGTVAKEMELLVDEPNDYPAFSDGTSRTRVFHEDQSKHRVLSGTMSAQDQLSIMTYDDDDDECHDYDLPQTYDPVYSALDRDAERFGQTQRHAQTQLRLQISNTTTETGDGEARASQQLLYELSDAIGTIPTSQVHERQEQLAKFRDEERVPSSQHEDGHLMSPAGEAVGTASVLIEEERVPSSPPIRPSAGIQAEMTSMHVTQQQLEDAEKTMLNLEVDVDDGRINSHGVRISQISTVMPTQMSPRSLRHDNVDIEPLAISLRSPQLTASQPDERAISSPSAIGILPISSPAKNCVTANSIAADTLTSSPLPLPPSSAPGSAHKRDDAFETQEAGAVDSVPDFSLPAPPPMSSSSRMGTQRGGFGGSSPPLK
ncbi:hypothetical protein Tdes44962_MAKER05126 [Teratosphaeria destructans]|uniref:Uncharacterized protein n=1 Tax=Teratosphaeria destructans TaxID=418781 RepID=A0A9W7SKP3_9PEZI|nr:hypothetical protein Tdes44962_MAKER05126 [Teratosphaeria destructans]